MLNLVILDTRPRRSAAANARVWTAAGSPLLVAELGLPADRWQLGFQSRLGPRQWLQPYTDKTLEKLAGEGVGKVQVMCPGFSVDCLETLEEIVMENRDVIMEAGGEHYGYIPCLNDHASHVALFASLLRRHLQGWVQATT